MSWQHLWTYLFGCLASEKERPGRLFKLGDGCGMFLGVVVFGGFFALLSRIAVGIGEMGPIGLGFIVLVLAATGAIGEYEMPTLPLAPRTRALTEVTTLLMLLGACAFPACLLWELLSASGFGEAEPRALPAVEQWVWLSLGIDGRLAWLVAVLCLFWPVMLMGRIAVHEGHGFSFMATLPVAVLVVVLARFVGTGGPTGPMLIGLTVAVLVFVTAPFELLPRSRRADRSESVLDVPPSAGEDRSELVPDALPSAGEDRRESIPRLPSPFREGLPAGEALLRDSRARLLPELLPRAALGACVIFSIALLGSLFGESWAPHAQVVSLAVYFAMRSWYLADSRLCQEATGASSIMMKVGRDREAWSVLPVAPRRLAAAVVEETRGPLYVQAGLACLAALLVFLPLPGSLAVRGTLGWLGVFAWLTALRQFLGPVLWGMSSAAEEGPGRMPGCFGGIFYGVAILAAVYWTPWWGVIAVVVTIVTHVGVVRWLSENLRHELCG
ncbi:MAG: hypothetical protein AAF533_01935 [Acidobacteriota bacterium]